MKKSILLLTCLLSVSYLSANTESEQALIEENFSKISQHIQQEQYDSVLKYIDNQSKEYFQKINYHIYNSQKDSILSLNLLDIYMITFIKNIITKQAINVYDENNALKSVIKNGREEYQPDRGLTQFNISDEWANAIYTIGGKETDKTSYFHKENNVWKINLLLGFDNAKPQLENILKKFNNSKQDMIESLGNKIGISNTFIYTPLPKNK